MFLLDFLEGDGIIGEVVRKWLLFKGFNGE
jgi:hypothetical protein